MIKTLTSDTYPDQGLEHTNVELAATCPLCHIALAPIILYSCVIVDSEDEDNSHVYALNYCPHCDECFITKHQYDSDDDVYHLRLSAPEYFGECTFSSNISKLSPSFVKIYNEAAQAESLGMTSICGMGYRKALEFLVKDYSISNPTASKDEIEKMPLAICIEKYIDDSRLKSLAKASAWLGNDETHYVKKHAAYGLNELKTFINAFVTFIDSDLAYQEAKAFLDSK